MQNLAARLLGSRKCSVTFCALVPPMAHVRSTYNVLRGTASRHMWDTDIAGYGAISPMTL